MIEFGCFVCGKGRTENPKSLCEFCGAPFDVSEEILKSRFADYQPQKQLGRGFYGTVVLVKNRIGREFALKVCSSSLYGERQKDFMEEVQRYIAVGDHPNIAELFDGGEAQIEVFGRTLKVFYLATRYLPNAVTLEDFIAGETFGVEDLIGIAVQVCAAISRVESQRLWHNDLHGRNVLLAARMPDDYDHHPAARRHLVKVVDFGSAIFKHPGPEKEWQDIQWIGKHLDAMLKRLRPNSDQLPKSDRWFITHLPALIDAATDANPSRQIKSARDFQERLELLWQKSARHAEWQPVKLTSAFGFTNANEFPDDSYVVALFSDKFPWLSKIGDGESTILLTGPRGCGKTMILRSLRLRSLMAKQREDETAKETRARIANAGCIGFFVSARLAVGLYRSLGETPAWLNSPVHSNSFFVLAILQEVIDSFLYGAETDLGLLTNSEMHGLCEVVEHILGNALSPTIKVTVAHFSRLERLSRSIEVLIARIVDQPKLSVDIPITVHSPKALLAVWEFLSKKVRLLKDQRVIFLLDDFTQPLVPEKCQRSFLPLMFGTLGYHFIVSAHSRSVALEDLSGVHYDPSREFTEINLGAEFVKEQEHTNRCEEFLDDIFKRRFEKANEFKNKRLRDLLGPSSYLGGGVAEEIAQRHVTKRLRGLKFHGVDTVVQLCTGDVSAIIELVGGLFRRQRTSEAATDIPISPSKQNAAIRLYARRELRKILDIREADGHGLYEIATKFGQMSREKILLYAREKKKPKGERAPQYLRIEIETTLSLPPNDEAKLRALLQHGIFVDGLMGAAHNGSPTQVLIFRKLFCPAFPTGIASQNSFSWTSATFARFLRNPRAVRFTESQSNEPPLDLFDEAVAIGDDVRELDDLEGA